KAQRESGSTAENATLEACQLRLRPIMMTSLAFILGVVPLMVSVGAGAEMRKTLGIAVFSGMLGGTLFGIFFTPVFYYVIQWFSDRRTAARRAQKLDEESDDEQAGGEASETAAVLTAGEHVPANGNGVAHGAKSHIAH